MQQKSHLLLTIDLGDFGECEGEITAAVEVDEFLGTHTVHATIEKVEIRNSLTSEWVDFTKWITDEKIRRRLTSDFETAIESKLNAG